MVWPDAGAQINALDADWGASLALHVRRDANGNETGLWIAVGAPGDSTIDRDGRGDPQLNQTVATHTGTVAVYGKVGGPTALWSQWSTELWAGGHAGIHLGPPRPVRRGGPHCRGALRLHRRLHRGRDADRRRARRGPDPPLRHLRAERRVLARASPTARPSPGTQPGARWARHSLPTAPGSSSPASRTTPSPASPPSSTAARARTWPPRRHTTSACRAADPLALDLVGQRLAVGASSRRCRPGLPAHRGRRRRCPGGPSRRRSRLAVRRRGRAQPRRRTPQPGRGRAGSSNRGRTSEPTRARRPSTSPRSPPDGRATWSEAAHLGRRRSRRSPTAATGAARSTGAFGTAISQLAGPRRRPRRRSRQRLARTSTPAAPTPSPPQR